MDACNEFSGADRMLLYVTTVINVGSNPTASTNGSVAQWIRALVYEAWGCKFESYQSHKF